MCGTVQVASAAPLPHSALNGAIDVGPSHRQRDSGIRSMPYASTDAVVRCLMIPTRRCASSSPLAIGRVRHGGPWRHRRSRSARFRARPILTGVMSQKCLSRPKSDEIRRIVLHDVVDGAPVRNTWVSNTLATGRRPPVEDMAHLLVGNACSRASRSPASRRQTCSGAERDPRWGVGQARETRSARRRCFRAR